MMVYQHLFADTALPANLRLAWLNEARQTALAAKDQAQADEWEKEPAAKK